MRMDIYFVFGVTSTPFLVSPFCPILFYMFTIAVYLLLWGCSYLLSLPFLFPKSRTIQAALLLAFFRGRSSILITMILAVLVQGRSG